MDSPESAAKVNPVVNASAAVNASLSSNSPPVQESPFSNYVSSFSPLNIDNASRVSQVFLGLNSPPLIFATPRVNPIHEAGLSKRPGNLEGSKEEETRDHEKDNKESHESVDWEKSAIDLDACFTTGPEDTGADNYEQVHRSGSSERVDKYLADIVEGDSTCSDNSVDQKLKQSGNVLRLSPNNVDTTVGSLRGMPEIEKERVMQARIEVNVKEQLAFDGGQREGTEEEINGERKCNHGSTELQDKCKCSDLQIEKVGYREECNFPSERAPEHMQTAQAPEDPNENVEPLLRRSTNNMVLESEVNQQQRGMSRRCLQFEEAQPKAMLNSNSPLMVAAPSQSLGASLESNAFDPNASSSSRQFIIASPTMINVSCPSSNAKQIVPPLKPSGIGLHLNSIVKAASFHRDANASMKLVDGSMSILEIRSKAITNSSSLEITTDESLQDTEDLRSMQIIDDHATPSDKRKFVQEDPDNLEQLSQLSPIRKKKKFSGSSDDDGCKRCNCKKTKCLKLYCDCFAAGIYCDESCSCQGCLNKREHEETVLQTRQQIESRNPLAFAPKIVQRGSEFSVNNMEGGNLTTPASARHKRGCNCKKSMCLKKYCECYQGGVGCSTGCRCENCKNIYGKKDDYISDELLSNRAISERSEPDEKTETVVPRKGSIHAEMHHLHRLTPATPSLQHSDHGKGAPKSQIIIRRFHSAPDSDPGSLRNSGGKDTSLETSSIPGLGSYDQETGHSSQEITRHFSSKFGQLVDVSHLTQLPDPLPTPVSSSALLFTSPKLDSISGMYDILEDDTPEILKDASTPIKPVKVSSPSRKRVSPPQRRLSETGSSSSGPLRSGRKFILRALPPFPPLTPCLESKSLANQTPDDPEQKQ